MKTIKVLLIDDDVIFGQIMTATLQTAGMDVHYQNSLAAVREVVKACQPSIVLMDIEVGNDDGIDAIPTIRTVMPTIPIIVVSSHTESQEVKRALEVGAINYLKKPFEMEELVAFVQRYAVPQTVNIQIGALTLDLESRILSKNGQKVKHLSPLEYALLVRLHQDIGLIVSKEELLKQGSNSNIDIHTLYNYIGKLKDLLKADPTLQLEKIQNGYRLTALY